jgi:hypothetical protein
MPVKMKARLLKLRINKRVLTGFGQRHKAGIFVDFGRKNLLHGFSKWLLMDNLSFAFPSQASMQHLQKGICRKRNPIHTLKRQTHEFKKEYARRQRHGDDPKTSRRPCGGILT